MKKKLKKVIVKLNLIKIISLPLFFFRIFKINNKKIVYVNFTGKGFGDNPKYIYEEINKRNNEYIHTWLINKNNVKKDEFPDNIKLVNIYSLRALFELATAKVWINNSRFDQYVVKRKEQLYIQTWHGGLALKKIEFDAEDKLSDYYKKVMLNDNKMIDAILSNSEFCTEMYKRGFKYNGNIMLSGSPRNDALINNLELNKSKVRKKFNISSKTKILLYAPTFRNNYDKNPYDINFNNLIKKIQLVGEDWKVFIKLHPRLQGSNISKKFDSKYINVTDYPDIQELICACDLLVTDYSSTMFEAMIIDKPVLLYANDIESYLDERGMYFSFDELPFELCKNNNEISLLNKNFFSNIESNYKIFKEKIGLHEKGDASKIVVDYIEKVIDDGKNE